MFFISGVLFVCRVLRGSDNKNISTSNNNILVEAMIISDNQDKRVTCGRREHGTSNDECKSVTCERREHGTSNDQHIGMISMTRERCERVHTRAYGVREYTEQRYVLLPSLRQRRERRDILP